jgi:alanyl-tRNA synthetase
MMTERIYYTDPTIREFDATVVAVDERDGKTAIRLDRTAFYPTSGGQPFDTGTIGDWLVTDVIDDGLEVVHFVRRPGPLGPGEEAGPKGPLPGQGTRVHGSIDWTRRFDHMQQHSGQHVLSAAFDRLFGDATVSFHLGTDASTIDVARELSPSQISEAVREANRVVWMDTPVAIRFVDAEEAARLPLRKAPAKEGSLRLIEIGDFDLSACGGTHVARTGSIGVIAVASWERFKGGQRIEFVCGGRALSRFETLRDSVHAAIRVLSVAPLELAASIERLQDELKGQRRTLSQMDSELARYRADELVAAADETPSGRLVARAFEGDASRLKMLASAITTHPRTVAVLVSTSRPALMVVARSADVTLDASSLLKALISRFGGRGGGKADLAQGGGLEASAETLLSEARAVIAVS